MSNVIPRGAPAAPCKINGGSNIPLRRTLSRSEPMSSTLKAATTNNEQNKWKAKYDESERKRKSLISQQEKTLRSFGDFEKKYTALQVKHEELETELFEKNETLTKLTTVSKNLFQEYEILKKKYETETEAMNRALNDASQWYKENKVLRRRTLLIDKDTVDEGVDTDESNCDNDLENLRESVKNFSLEIAQLQAELNSSKLLEFETQEINANLTQELEIERKKTQKLEAELLELKQNTEQILRVSNMLKRELEGLKEQEERGRDNADVLRKEADSYKRERNVLAHQSTLLLQGLNSSETMDTMVLLKETEDLKRALEDERNRFNFEVSSLQEKLDEQEANSYSEILEERLKLIESELEHAVERAEKAEMLLEKERLLKEDLLDEDILDNDLLNTETLLGKEWRLDNECSLDKEEILNKKDLSHKEEVLNLDLANKIATNNREANRRALIKKQTLLAEKEKALTWKEKVLLDKEKALEEKEKALAAPPVPPPPPPPPLEQLVSSTQTPVVPLRTKKLQRNSVTEIEESTPSHDLAQETKKVLVGVNDDIINQIKGGTFTLKKRKNDGSKDRETPKAVSEMLNVLGSLRRVRNKNRLSTSFGDVQL